MITIPVLLVFPTALADDVAVGGSFPLMEFAHHLQARTGYRVTFEGVVNASEADLTRNFATAPKTTLSCDVGEVRASLEATRRTVRACLERTNATSPCKRYEARDVPGGVAIVPVRRHDGTACVDFASPLDVGGRQPGAGAVVVRRHTRLFTYLQGRQASRSLLDAFYADTGEVHVAFPSTWRGELTYVVSTADIGGPFIGHDPGPDSGPFYFHRDAHPSPIPQSVLDRVRATDENGGTWDVQTMGLPPQSPQPEVEAPSHSPE